jgi:hypothetical protein
MRNFSNALTILWHPCGIFHLPHYRIKPGFVAQKTTSSRRIAVWGRKTTSQGEKPAMRKVLSVCLAVCFLFALTALAFDDMGKSATVKGWIADDKCGAKGANAGAEACTKKCLAAGAKMVVVTDGDSKVLAVENPDALKGHEGHHVAVTGTMGKDSIKVDSVKML